MQNYSLNQGFRCHYTTVSQGYMSTLLLLVHCLIASLTLGNFELHLVRTSVVIAPKKVTTFAEDDICIQI